MMKKALTLLFFLCTFTPVLTQPYMVKSLGKESGLSNNNVLGIAQDKEGFLWFATEEGLNRLDGESFTSFYKTSLTDEGLTGNELNCLFDDPVDSILWIGTQRSGLNGYNYITGQFINYKHNRADTTSLITDDITSIVRASDGNLWISTYWRGVDYFDKKRGTFTHYNKETIKGLTDNQVWSVLDGNDGFLYVGHVSAGFTIISLKNQTARNYQHEPNDDSSLPGNSVTSIYKDKMGNIWLGTDSGLALYNPVDGKFISFKKSSSLLSSHIFDIKQFSDDKLWLALEFGGIIVLDLPKYPSQLAQSLTFTHIESGSQESNLTSSSIRSLFQDSYGNIWAGTWGGGINFISREDTRFKRINHLSQVNSPNNGKIIGAVCVDQKGSVWVGTEEGNITILTREKEQFSYNLQSDDFKKSPIQAALCDSNGEIWFGIFAGGAYYYDEQERKMKQLFTGTECENDIRVIYQNRNNPQFIWLGSSKGLYKVDAVQKKVLSHYLHNQLIRAIYQDEKKYTWIGTFGEGLSIYDEHFNLVKKFHTSDGFPSNTINSIYCDSKGKVWVGTGEGLVCFSAGAQEKYVVYNENVGLDNIHIRAITEDESGNIWFSTNKTIGCYHRLKGIFYTYGERDNIPLDGFLSGCVARDLNDDLFFGSYNGLCFFKPKQILEEKEAPPAIVTEMKILGSLTEMGWSEQTISLQNQVVRLTHEQSSFRLTFNIPNYALANQVEYAYMLKGLENIWYPVVNTNSVTFRNIPPGNYLLKLKTRLRNQEWSDEITQLEIEIASPLWLTWWAKLLYLVIITVVVATIIQMYNSRFRAETLYKLEKKKHEQEQELNDERLRFYTNITHELRTPLTLILGPLEDLLKQNSLSPKDGKKVSVIHQSAIRLLNLINQLLEFRKTETQNKKLCVSRGNLTNLIFEIGLKYKELNQNEALNFSIETSVEELSLFYDKEVITMIIDNLLSNAIKYTPSGHITLSLDTEVKEGTAYATISVSDTGHGIAPEALNSIYDRYYQANSEHQASGTGIGLSLVKNLVALHEATIEVESQLDKGSCFTVKLLIDNTYPHLLHAEPKVEEEKSEEASETEPKEVGKRILLVVEDNPDIRTYIADSFSEWFDVRMATNGKEGVERAFELIPDLIVSDVMMPIMSGTALCEQLKKDIRTSHIPIILLTAKDTLQDKEDGYQAGADSYLTKPFSATLLQSRINNLLDSRKTLANHFGEKSELKEKKSTISSALNKIDDEFLTKINQLIEERMTEDKIEIGYLADKLCMSHSTLYRKMKALTGLSTNEYIRKVKMRHAERLLLEGKYTISEITFKMGFNSSVYFRQCFKEEFGMLPSEYLKKLTKEES